MHRTWIAAAAAVGVIVSILFVMQPVDGAAPQSRFSNIQVLTDMTDREINLTMASWTQQFGVTCFECHVEGDFASDARGRKLTARRMAQIVRALNETPYFSQAARTADCFLCHQGSFEIPEFQ